MKKNTDPRRQAYDEVLKAMRKRQRARRRASVTHAQAMADTLNEHVSVDDARAYLAEQQTLARCKSDEADGMSELILMVKNMRDHGAVAS
jgi:hypothetical protein